MDKKSERLYVKVTAEEKAAIKEKMQKIGMTNLSEFVRLAVAVNPVVNLDMNAIYKLSYEMNRIGNNINQIAKMANTSKHIYKSDIDEVNAGLKQLNNFISLINKKSYLSECV
ncbi:MAG: MobC family plasmid mobilization relaxosome protein [Clostridiales bacterium]|nr:MobC family plasmid mobilization relaxosome protein [Clostridiales bacterium]